MANDWLDILEPFPQDAIEHACRTYLQAQPSRRPTPGDIRNRAVAYLTATRPKKREPEPPRLNAPERKPVDPERAQRILEEAGFTEGKMNLVKRFPKAVSMADAERMAEAGDTKPHWTETVDPDGPEMAQLRAARDANPLVQAARRAQAAE